MATVIAAIVGVTLFLGLFRLADVLSRSAKAEAALKRIHLL